MNEGKNDFSCRTCKFPNFLQISLLTTQRRHSEIRLHDDSNFKNCQNKNLAGDLAGGEMKGFVLPDFKVLVLLQLLAVLPSVTLILGTCPMGEDKSKNTNKISIG